MHSCGSSCDFLVSGVRRSVVALAWSTQGNSIVMPSDLQGPTNTSQESTLQRNMALTRDHYFRFTFPYVAP